MSARKNKRSDHEIEEWTTAEIEALGMKVDEIVADAATQADIESMPALTADEIVPGALTQAEVEAFAMTAEQLCELEPSGRRGRRVRMRPVGNKS